MDTVEGIEKFRDSSREIAMISAVCRICGIIAWIDYYGTYACRKCCCFFLDTVIHRKEYWCVYYGSCQTKNKLKITCYFCWLKRCIYSGLLPEKVGMNELCSCFLKETKRLRKKVDAESAISLKVFHEIIALKKMLRSCNKAFRKHRPFRLHRIVDCQKHPKFRWRDAALAIALNSMHFHGNIVLKRCILDPYKFPISPIQELFIQILNLAELLKLCADRNVGLIYNKAAIIKLTYFEELDKKNEPICILQTKLLKIDSYMSNCESFINNFDKEMNKRQQYSF